MALSSELLGLGDGVIVMGEDVQLGVLDTDVMTPLRLRTVVTPDCCASDSRALLPVRIGFGWCGVGCCRAYRLGTRRRGLHHLGPETWE